jgi:Putative Flp pilus-assembly TadE/G-like
VRVRRARGERGAIAVVAAVSIVSILGFTALTVDMGNNWQHRRGLINGTDAAALAAAQEYALGGTGCGSLAATYVVNNRSDATMTACTPSASATSGVTGSITVAAETTVEYFFAPIIGLHDKVISSSTTAQFGRPLSSYGLRPLGLCEELLADVQEFKDFMNNPVWYKGLPDTDPAKIAHIPYDKSANPSACNGGDAVPGNWALMDFDGGANSASDTADWVQNGFPGEVERDHPYPGDTGALSNSLSQELNYLVDNNVEFGLPLFISAAGTGSNATFIISGFVAVQIVDFRVTGPDTARYIDLVFRATTLEGVCCYTGPADDTKVRVVQICATDATNATLNCAS